MGSDPAPEARITARRNVAETEPWALTATEVARAVRTRILSAREVTESVLARIAHAEPRLNALAEVSGEEALAAADAADCAAAAGAAPGPLHGVPVTIKVNTDQAGHATTKGVPAFRDHIAGVDAPVVARLRAAGAIIVGRTNASTFSLRWCAENELHGRTLNPWSPDRTPGGSSGGAAAAVASGVGAIAQANDYGGSIRYPAYACGVAGLRPTVGRVPWDPGAWRDSVPVTHQLMAVEGPLARTVADLRLALDVMAGASTRDPFAVPARVGLEAPERPIRVGMVRDPGVVAPCSSVRAALDAAARSLDDAGYVLEEVELGLLAEAYRLWYLLCVEDNRPYGAAVRKLGGPSAVRLLDTQLVVERQWWPRPPTLAQYVAGFARRDAIIRDLHAVLREIPLLLMPTSAEPPFEHGEDLISDEAAIRLAAAQWPCTALPVLGVPAVAVPVSVAAGLPVGVQLVAGRFREDLLLAAAEVIEAHSEVALPVPVCAGTRGQAGGMSTIGLTTAPERASSAARSISSSS